MTATDPDAELMLAFAAGDGQAFDALFRRWAAPLVRYVERMVRDRAVAEDLVQETFVRVHRARDRYEPQAKFSTWLYRIATNLALNELARAHRSQPHLSVDAPANPGDGASGAAPSLPAPGARSDDMLDTQRAGHRVRDAMSELPERQRVALWLSAGEGLSYAEVGEVLGASESSVKSLVHRARAAVVSRLGSLGEVLGTDPGAGDLGPEEGGAR